VDRISTIYSSILLIVLIHSLRRLSVSSTVYSLNFMLSNSIQLTTSEIQNHFDPATSSLANCNSKHSDCEQSGGRSCLGCAVFLVDHSHCQFRVRYTNSKDNN
jgi:hypothetical protein